MKVKDDKTVLHALSYQAPKIRLLRSLTIDGGSAMQVLDFAGIPEPMFDMPIFCANFFTIPSLSIIVLDLNPMYDTRTQQDYKEKYYLKLLPLGQKYAELLPWGDKITSESLSFFSPIVIWTKFATSQTKHDVLFSAFRDYFKAWLELVDQALPETNSLQILHNKEAQHRYLTWRAEKDLVRNFLFEGADSLGTKTFLDYFPEYRREDGSVNQKRSVIGKSYETRPWNSNGEFIGEMS
ncbi:Phytochromobilin:ferredoxin oxidoreductase protein [Dioscorea alata]|nr:Phytochromobilin:ferredoxin oxidoreductase protein [Dioscorea alata]KAH7667877.1 Phytochromobilin:ferredoxin oxidoreductase protein [Dioscorea alata]KAH7667879.1 Phytochromobilin:ferredoxin oxidoreductase protein [Dioscorea alata]